ncbi:hypothetical protein GGR54DRAFT_572635 [Hypoxylon sp. NC1633]|nr:hypothetical protein GGR54DRAFT_572635 [Hypoxylon sp. NC1633]
MGSSQGSISLNFNDQTAGGMSQGQFTSSESLNESSQAISDPDGKVNDPFAPWKFFERPMPLSDLSTKWHPLALPPPAHYYVFPIRRKDALPQRREFNVKNVGLCQPVETTLFRDIAEVKQHLVNVYAPLIGEVGNVAKQILNLSRQPAIKFEPFPIRINECTDIITLHPSTTSRGPVFQITIPYERRSDIGREAAQSVCDALRSKFATFDNTWHKQAGIMFRFSRRSVDEARQFPRERWWIPPKFFYEYTSMMERYMPHHIPEASDSLTDLAYGHEYADDSDDDLDVLFSDMWKNVREVSRNVQDLRELYGAEDLSV